MLHNKGWTRAEYFNQAVMFLPFVTPLLQVFWWHWGKTLLNIEKYFSAQESAQVNINILAMNN